MLCVGGTTTTSSTSSWHLTITISAVLLALSPAFSKKLLAVALKLPEGDVLEIGILKVTFSSSSWLIERSLTFFKKFKLGTESSTATLSSSRLPLFSTKTSTSTRETSQTFACDGFTTILLIGKSCFKRSILRVKVSSSLCSALFSSVPFTVILTFTLPASAESSTSNSNISSSVSPPSMLEISAVSPSTSLPSGSASI